MCGIGGILYRDPARPVEIDVLRGIASAMSHRGPDGEGIWQSDGIGLVHRRLSIIDLAGGAQPMSNEDGSLQVVFNGEIYNYPALRQQLEARGHRLSTRSDTEVLVHLYEDHDQELVNYLRGMFAFAIWDSHNRSLLLGRDRVGQKPLYVYQDETKLVFGSEIKCILACPEIDRTIDIEAVEDYFCFGMVPGERSIFKSVRKLPAAHTRKISSQNWRSQSRRYWQFVPQIRSGISIEDWCQRIREKTEETVRAHQISDVPVGAFLSGGIDSSVIVATISGLQSEPLQTFSIGFQEARFSELPFARETANHFGCRHTEQIVTPDAIASLDDLVHFYDEPFADSSAIPTLYVSRLARQFVKVVLSGDGGDEAFGGYRRYAHDLREARVRRMIPVWLQKTVLAGLARYWPRADWLPRVLRAKTALTNLSLSPDRAYANTLSLCRLPLRRRLFSDGVRSLLNGHRPESIVWNAFRASGTTDQLGCMTTADIGTLLPDDFLTKVDRASMACGLEVRPPLVDHELLELAGQIPSDLKVRSHETKWIFKEAFRTSLPQDILTRPKQGFDIPIDDWLRGPLREQFEAIVLTNSSSASQFINVGECRRLYQSHCRHTGRHGDLLWAILVFARWCDEYIKSDRTEIVRDRRQVAIR